MMMTFAALAFVAATSEIDTPPDPCQAVGSLAAQIMDHRQAGTSMSDLMAAAGHIELARLLIIEAYNIPRMSVPENQLREVQDFRNMAEAMCYQIQ